MEKDILYNAIENFSKYAAFNLEVSSLSSYSNTDRYDGELLLKSKKKIFNFAFLVKVKLTFSKISTIDQLNDGENNIILISDYIPKLLKTHLKRKNISYLDLAGNAFITNDKGVFIYLETNKNLRFTIGKSNRAFSKSGLKVVYQILINDQVINMSYRDIGELSKVSIDTVGKVIKELLRDDYLIRLNKKTLKVKNKERLFQEWVTIFNKLLRPKLKQRNFKLKNFKINTLLKTSSLDTIGGELAAESLSNYLIAEKAIIYTNEPFVDVALQMQLMPATNGSIILVEKFWNNKLSDTVEVHPILIYADLLDNPKPRNLEAAKIIYNKYVKDIL